MSKLRKKPPSYHYTERPGDFAAVCGAVAPSIFTSLPRRVTCIKCLRVLRIESRERDQK